MMGNWLGIRGEGTGMCGVADMEISRGRDTFVRWSGGKGWLRFFSHKEKALPDACPDSLLFPIIMACRQSVPLAWLPSCHQFQRT
jgi:hypothetical protein